MNNAETEMNKHEQAVYELLLDKELKADHPITCLNPEEWFTVDKVSINEGRVWVIGKETCWFSLTMCQRRQKLTF